MNGAGRGPDKEKQGMSANKRVDWGRGVAVLATGLASCAAHAQFEATYQGVLDFSYGRFEPSGFYREHRFNSNSLTASFVSGTVKYGLDNGWTPGITLETFVRLQDMQTGRNQDDPLLSRNAFAFLNGPYGLVRVGRLQTFLFDTTTRFNALGNSVPFSPAIRHLFGSGTVQGVNRDFYWNQALSYTSPRIEEGALQGLTVNVMAARGESNDDGDLAAANVVWSRGLLAVALSVQNVHVNDGIEDETDERAWQLGASYNFGIVRVFGLHTQTRDHGLEVRSKLTSAGLSFPLGPGSVLAQAGYTTAKGPAVDRRHTSVSAAYLYPYDSQTDLYVVGMDDRIRGLTKGRSLAAGVRWRF